MKGKRFVRTALAGALLLAASAGSAWARGMMDDDFRRGPKGRVAGGAWVEDADGTKGWQGRGGDDPAGANATFLSYDLEPPVFRPGTGTIVVSVRRDEVKDPEALFSLADKDGQRLFAFRVYWEGLWHSGGRPEFHGYAGAVERRDRGWYDEDSDQTYPSLVFPSRVARGETVRLALTWGGPDGYAVFVNGNRLAGKTREAHFLGEALARATRLLVGAEFSPGGEAYDMTRSAVQGVRIFDRPLTASELRADSVIESVSAERSVYGAGQELVVTLRGTKDRDASFAVAGVTGAVAMSEVDDGVYVGRAVVPSGVVIASAPVAGTLTKPGTTYSITESGASVSVDGDAPEAVVRMIASSPWAGEVEVAWEASPSADTDLYRVYRGEGKDPALGGPAFAEARELKFVDTRVVPGLEYRYAVVPVDRAGNAGAASAVVSAVAPAGEGPKIASVGAGSLEKPLRPGAVVPLTLVGQSGGQATVDVGSLAQGVALVEQGRTGRYVGTYTVKDGDVQAARSAQRVVGHLADALGVATLGGPEIAVVGLDGLNDKTPPTVTKVAHDGWQVAGLSGKLVAGDRVTVTLEGEPGGYAAFELSEVAGRVAMKETAPGVYSGSFVVPWGAEGAAVPVTAYLADEGGNETALEADRALAFDTRVRLTVSAKDALLPADRKSQTRLTARAADANGNRVSGHELALTLSTTQEYTGVVGGGDVEGRMARMEDEDDVEVRWGGVTDNFGEAGATYTAGFAAKTALVVAKDLTTGSVGAGWLNTYVASTVAIELTPRVQRGAVDKAVMRISADPAKLTADGRSTSRIKVWLTDLSGSPIGGARVAFALGNANGRLKVLRGGQTDARGVAEAEYRAGTLAGAVTITSSAAEYGVTAAVQILLLADAPAKIDLVASAGRLVANGSDQAKLSVLVSDVHGNPNDNVPVTFAVLKGSGKVSAATIHTNKGGEGSVVFTAGTAAGTAIVEARHTSRAPSEEELRRVYGTVFVPRLFERQERDRVTLTEWAVKPGDEVEKGQVLATLESRIGSVTLRAPAKGVFVREIKHERDRVELGDTVGYVEIDPEVWKAEYGK